MLLGLGVANVNKGSYTTAKPWRAAEREWTLASSSGKPMAILFGDAGVSTGSVFRWAMLTSLQIGATGTTTTWHQIMKLRGRNASELIKVSDGEPVGAVLRVSSVVRTPDFLQRLAHASVGGVGGDADDAADQTAEELVGLEGAARVRMVVHRRRERRMRDAKIMEALAANRNRLMCEVVGCGFDFEAVYGALGSGYAQVHHTRPLGDRTRDEATRLADLAVVCANCHAMIHRGNQCRDLASLIERSR